jgi:ParB-like chromosome segregation protein Spo0J
MAWHTARNKDDPGALNMAKTFEHATRTDAQSINPLYLCIVGGLALPEDERGKLDTAWDPKHPLHAHDLLRPLDPLDVDSVYEHGVIVPIEVIRGPGDVPMVNAGRGRVRKARLANLRRKAAGLPPIEVKFTVVRISNDLQLLARSTAENLRRKTFGLLDQIALAKQWLLAGASEETTAKEIGIPLSRFKAILEFEDNATPTVKEALRQGRVSPSAGFVLAGIKDPAEQDAKLADLLTAPKPTVRAARQLQLGTTDAPPRRPQQKRLLARIEHHTKGDPWMQGVKAALDWVLNGTTHRDLDKVFDSEESAPKAKKKAT